GMETGRIYRHEELMDDRFPFRMDVLSSQRLNTMWHAHDYFQLCLINKGACFHRLSRGPYKVMKGDVLFIPPYTWHAFAPIEGQHAEMVQIDFTRGMLVSDAEEEAADETDVILPLRYRPVEEAGCIPKLTVGTSTHMQLEQLLDGICREISKQERGYRQLVRADLNKILVYLNREINIAGVNRREVARLGKRYRRLQDAIGYINANFKQELKLGDVARRAAMAPGYFCYLFKQEMSKTFVEYINHLRIQHAMALIRDSDWKIIDIMLDAGFNHIGHFNRIFRKLTGVTPSQFRKANEDGPGTYAPLMETPEDHDIYEWCTV
ncbi:MAG: helix-turn-helix transcriptional regulator, partial [Paenibacillaceae bacterium]|nr:helix-turn-helix transcriptional regulator [Paenibacillaceae bacterium]